MDDLNTPATLQQIQHCLLLNRIVGLGPNRQQQLRDHFHGGGAILSASKAELDGLPRPLREEITARQRPNHPDRLWVDAEIERCHQQGIHLLNIESPHYPSLLKECVGPPTVLYIKGDPLLLTDRQLAIVGGRKASQQGLMDACQWAKRISEQGICITSGLAEGIDGAAHQGAINAGGKTIAVLAHGLDTVYPKRHAKLAEQVIEQGALVSEFSFGTPPKREFFPRRNRIISGLSEALLVMAAAKKSGSLISARYAIEQNRDVFAVPGSIHDHMVAGCLQLIQDGAFAADSADYIMQVMGWDVASCRVKIKDKANPQQVPPLLALIPFDMTHLDVLITQTGLGGAELLAALLQFEAAGLIEQQSGCYRRLIPVF